MESRFEGFPTGTTVVTARELASTKKRAMLSAHGWPATLCLAESGSLFPYTSSSSTTVLSLVAQ